MRLANNPGGEGRMYLLMTRPKGAAERFVALLPPELRDRLTLVCSPLVAIVPVATDIRFDDACGLIFTSSNAVSIAAGLTRRRDLTCYCLGKATTHAAHQAGWQAQYMGADAEALVKSLEQIPSKGPWLHLRGAHARGNVAVRLAELGCQTTEQIIYDQPLLPLSDDAKKILMGTSPVIAPLFSPRTARQFANLVTGPAPLCLGALSAAVALPVKGLKYRVLKVASRPDADAMARLVGILSQAAQRVEGGRSAQ